MKRDRRTDRHGWEALAPEVRRQVGALLVVAVGLVGYAALIWPQGWAARALAQGLKVTLGLLAWCVPGLVAGFGALQLMRPQGPGWHRPTGVALASLGLDLGLGWASPAWGGWIGAHLAGALEEALGAAGTVVLALLALVVGIVVGGELEAATLFRGLGQGLAWAGQGLAALVVMGVRALRDWVATPVVEDAPAATPVIPAKKRPAARQASPSGPPSPPKASGASPAPAPEPPPPPPAPPWPRAGQGWRPPPLTLLEAREGHRGGGRSSPSAAERAEVLRTALAQFGIEVKLGEVSQGPAITRFEIIPPPGVKVARILSLADDIALSLAAAGVRIEAPIPGKSAIGIEVPNPEVTPVLLREVLESREFAVSPSPLTVALGKDVAGAPVVTALDQMPHLLVAGATGSGKSVLINVLITSLLFRASPEMVRLLLIDPKVVELSVYNGIPHLLGPVVTDPKKAAMALRWAVKEMERRYRLFADVGVRDIHRYNQWAGEHHEEPLPYVVVIIDELADLMMVAPADVEESIARLAQMARACGMHLVVATQRPSVDVITGTIKANIPSRIAFAVSSQIDSRTILDGPGAEKLLGRGDMLFYPVGAAKPIRLQGALIREKEIEAIVAHLAAEGKPPPSALELDAGEDDAPTETPDSDPLFVDALALVVETRQASASMLQRRFRIGYARAARLIDAMEERGFVGPQEGARAREVRLTLDQFRRLFSSLPPSSTSG